MICSLRMFAKGYRLALSLLCLYCSIATKWFSYIVLRALDRERPTDGGTHMS